MLRPATPLSILFFVAFILLLLSTLSTPVIKAIPLAEFNGTEFGVWGYCNNGNCSGVEIGYDTNNLFTSAGEFSLPQGTRHSVSYILIIHPVAALLSLICTGLAIASHFHAPGHSPRFLLGLFILTIPTLLASLLAFLVDILLFIPHVSWGGWIVLAATIIIIVASLVTCCMRRTLVSRKARRKRIQENAEMSGENYFNALGAKRAAEAQVASLPRAESPPPLSGGSNVPLNDKSSFSFANYDSKPNATPEDGIPLTSSSVLPAGSIRSASAGGYNDPSRQRSGSVPRNLDQYGNPIMAGGMRRPSTESNRSDGFYGRGGFPPGPGRGGFPPRGGPMMRGGPGGIRGPPPGYRGGRGGLPGGPMMGRGGPPQGYGPQDRYSPSPYGDAPRSVPPPGPQNLPEIGQAIEMDGTNGVPSPARSPVTASPPGGGGLIGADEYVPPRAQWSQKPSGPPPAFAKANRGLSPIAASPVDSGSKYSSGGHARTASGSYYEDVDPRFAIDAPPGTIPAPLMAGGPGPIARSGPPPASNPHYAPQNNTHLMPTGQHPEIANMQQESQESLQEGQRSPATSDTSHFTSVSQRGVNPNWRPPPGQQGPMMRGPPPSRTNEMLLDSNPEFSIPGVGGPGRGRGGFRGRGGMGPGRQSPGMGPPSRYPI